MGLGGVAVLLAGLLLAKPIDVAELVEVLRDVTRSSGANDPTASPG